MGSMPNCLRYTVGSANKTTTELLPLGPIIRDKLFNEFSLVMNDHHLHVNIQIIIYTHR